MELASENRNDLTTTIHLTSLRSVESTTKKLMEEAGPELVKTLDELEPGRAMLVSLIGPNRGARYLLEPTETKLGRSPESDIFLDDVTVSRKHAVISRNSDSYVINDVGSLNGTYCNGEIVENSRLIDGDEIQIGKFRMHFFSGKVKE